MLALPYPVRLKDSHFSSTYFINSNLMSLFIFYQYAKLSVSMLSLSLFLQLPGLWFCFCKHFFSFISYLLHDVSPKDASPLLMPIVRQEL